MFFLSIAGSRSCGFSLQGFYTFAVFGGAMFLSYWLFPALNHANTNTVDIKGKKGPKVFLLHVFAYRSSLSCKGRLLWWTSGLAILLGAGWMWNGLLLIIYEIAERLELIPGINWHYSGHNISTFSGYFGIVILWVLLWYQNPIIDIEDPDATGTTTTLLTDWSTQICGSPFSIVWIKRQFPVYYAEKNTKASTFNLRQLKVILVVILMLGIEAFTVLIVT